MILRGDTYYVFKVGLKGLELLGENVNYHVKDNLDFILYCGLIGQYPNITLREIHRIKDGLSEKQVEKIQNYITQLTLVSPAELSGLYSKCSEMGLNPEQFFSLTLEEIDLMYEGYLRRKELECNLFLIAINQSKNRPQELVSFIENKGYEIGSQEEREHTFQALGINEV